ncbi:PAS sensor protein [Mycobacterium sp. CBMA 234]|uniref:PAS domain-containing protein n=1 Tax=Mycolicibacterium sp. CBMA 234 TaxID=1918495 RepID=UPI0012DFB8F4|nr:PAS domain-containing protein [Mycolicibacterium sp. CBMA 234]MUL64469.1 PAS sensor protein [Mycolicibacterium sp. CBMA 234]
MDASDTAGGGSTASVIVDRRGIIHHWGDAVTEVVGYSADDVVGQSLNVIIPPALQPVHWWGFDQAMATGRLDRELFKVPAVCKDGQLVVAHATIDLIAGDDGATNGAVVTFVGVGAPWQGAAWRIGLAPFNFARRILRRRSSAKAT